jgi:serine/threonine-protein kinase
LHSTLSGDVQACDGFANEVARFASIGEHPNIIGILEGVMSDVTGVPYYVMEAFDGYSLDHLLEEGKSLAVPLWKPVFTSLFDVMVYIHDRGVIHCDVKPGNILFNDLGNVKILDFGSAVFSEVSGEISRSISQGYSPPEQYNSQPIDVRADIYSMGVTIYECLTGVRPRNALDRLTDPSAAPVPPSSLSRILNKEVDSVVARMIDLDPNRRFQTTREARDLFFSAIEPILPS